MSGQWEVLTPEYGDRIVVCDDGTGPMEYGRDWALVTASTAREAVSIAVRAWLRGENPDEDSPGPLYTRTTYCQRQRDDGMCPWTGVRATAWVEPADREDGWRFNTGNAADPDEWVKCKNAWHRPAPLVEGEQG